MSFIYCATLKTSAGDGRGQPDGGHGAVLRGAAGRDEAAVGGQWGAGVLLSIQ